jgi:hypothetical protein
MGGSRLRVASQIVLNLTEREFERMFTLLEPVAMARPLILNMIKAVRATGSDHLRLQLKRDTASQIIRLLRELDAQGTVLVSRAAAFRGNGACSAAHYFVGTGA